MAANNKMSYSKMETYEQCGWKFLLQYIEGPYISTPGVALDVGTMIHDAEEQIANAIKDGQTIDYNRLKNNIILKTVEIEHKFPKDFWEKDKADKYYKDKIYEYLSKGIYRLETFMKEHPEIEIVGAEVPFKFEKFGYNFSGKIDRLLRNKVTGEYICQDIKTWAEEKDKDELTTPLQFVVYTIAIKGMYDIPTEEITCQYDLPFCNTVQAAGTKGYMNRGLKKMEKLINGINSQVYEPNPSPLCHWCTYCATNPNQPSDPNAHNRCPYYSLWTKEKKNFNVKNEWQGMENHKPVLENYIQNQAKETV
jgi:hypothetical protein